ncbi:MAG: hypothetical protein NTY77_09080 [Elusimicrobia bacterium]|nr:hypothetical protein [Elusimicrobiota bacterium]
MLSARRPELRVALCLLLAGAQLAPAAPAAAAVIQAQGVRTVAAPGVNGLPFWSAPETQAALRLGSALAPGLSGSIPVLPAPAVRAETKLVIAAVPQAAAIPASVAALAAPASENSPVSVVAGLARTGSAISGEQDRGGEKTGAALDSLYSGQARPVAAEPAAVAAEPQAASVPALFPARRAAVGFADPASPRIVRIIDEAGQDPQIEVGVSDLLLPADAQSRADLSRQVAREALGALGSEDPAGRQAAALADFLRDTADYRPEGAVSARLEMDGQNHFRLVFERGDGGRKVLLGQFLPGTAPDGRTGPAAFIVMGPAEVSAHDKVRQDHPGYWREYAGGGLRLEWRSVARAEKKGWGPWAYELGLRDASLTEQAWRDGGWQDGETRPVKTVTAVQTRSWLGRAAAGFLKVPVLGHILRFSDGVAETVLTGLMIAQHMLAAAFGGPRWHHIEAAADLAKNPLLKLLTRDQWHLDRLSPAAREKLLAKVREERAAAVAGQLFPVAPELVRQLVDAPIDAREAVAALRSQYGIGTFGRRLIHAGSAAKGWKSAGLIAAGVLTGALEGAAESVCNPILWAMLGLGSAVGAAGKAAPALTALGAAPWVMAFSGDALMGLALFCSELVATVRGTSGALAGLYALRAAHATATALWWGPWLFSATDHVGRMVQLTARGEYDKDYFKQLSKAGTDAIYYFVIP